MYNVLLVIGLIFFNSVVFSASNDGVYYNDGKIHYEGEITYKKNKIFFDLVDKNKTHDIYINSGGGDVEQGMELGDFIYKNKMNVYITDYCFSSCANYIFTSGKNKFISEHALIGYHGGAHSFKIDQFMIEQENYLKRKLTKKEIMHYNKEFNDHMKKITFEQDAFYSKRNINKKIASLGSNAYPNIKYDLDYYTIPDFKKLGVSDIHVIGGRNWEPKDSGHIIVINKNYKQNTKDKDKYKLMLLDVNDLPDFR